MHPKIKAILARVKDGVIEGHVIMSGLQLTSLPDLSGVKVTGYFDCGYNRLTSLAGAPSKVGGGGFVCSYNQLTSLAGAPISVGGDFICSANNLTSIEGLPEFIGKALYYSRNPVFNQESADDLKLLRQLERRRSIEHLTA